MRVFILGGTGSIGTAIVGELRKRSHDVVALSRSEASDRKLENMGAIPLRGDLREPAAWIDDAFAREAIVHVAATFSDDMGEVDDKVVSALIERAHAAAATRRLLYTGGAGSTARPATWSRRRKAPSTPCPPSHGWSRTRRD
jgi:nucleoside-diphosphate-sugar epimerase